MKKIWSPWKRLVFYGVCPCIAFGLLNLWWQAKLKDSSGLSSNPTAPSAQRDRFRIAIAKEPTHFDPGNLKGSEGGYVLPQLYATLLRWKEGQILPLVAKDCFKTSTKIWRCELNSNYRWSNGTSLTAHDFARAHQRILQKQVQGTLGLTLFEPVEKVEALSDLQLQIVLHKPVGDFKLRLTSIALAAIPESELVGKVFSGPYTIAEQISSQKLVLAPNPHWPTPPPLKIEYVFASDDFTALTLYRNGEIDFLKRLPTALIAEFRNMPDFHQQPMARMDYIGFGPTFKNDPHARKALALAVNYPESRHLTQSPSILGCTTFPKYFTNDSFCLTFNKTAAQFEKTKSSLLKTPHLTLEYSQQGGEDHGRFMQWLQSEWRQNLGLEIALKSQENHFFLERLKKRQAQLFRKGMTLTRSSCLAGLEAFSPHRTENYIDFRNSKFSQILTQLETVEFGPTSQKLCREGLEILMQDFALIPLGPIYFTFLVKPQFTGWSLNELNELDLSDLRPQ